MSKFWLYGLKTKVALFQMVRNSENFEYRKLDRNNFSNAKNAITTNFRKSAFYENQNLRNMLTGNILQLFVYESDNKIYRNQNDHIKKRGLSVCEQRSVNDLLSMIGIGSLKLRNLGFFC